MMNMKKTSKLRGGQLHSFLSQCAASNSPQEFRSSKNYLLTNFWKRHRAKEQSAAYKTRKVCFSQLLRVACIIDGLSRTVNTCTATPWHDPCFRGVDTHTSELLWREPLCVCVLQGICSQRPCLKKRIVPILTDMAAHYSRTLGQCGFFSCVLEIYRDLM